MGAWSREKPCPQSPVRAGGGVVKGRAPPRIPLEGGVNPLWPHACLPPSQQPSAPLLAPAPTLPLWVLPWPPPCPRGHWREASPAMTSTWAPSGLAAAGLGGPGTPPPLAGRPPALRARGLPAGGRAGWAGWQRLSCGPAFPDSFQKAGPARSPTPRLPRWPPSHSSSCSLQLPPPGLRAPATPGRLP